MKTTIDSAGRMVIPRDIRQEAGIQPGMPLEIRWHEGRIEIEPAALPVKLVRKGKLLVAVPQHDISHLKAATVERTRKSLSQERTPRL
jgi:AbrB family looped-hinge helix DNA binding protein